MRTSTRTVLCFGDSNTHGTCPIASDGIRRRHDRRTRWTGLLAERLERDWHVIEEGLPGRTTVHDDPIEGEHLNGLRVLPAILHSHRPLDAVIVMLGTNDLKSRFAATPADIALGVERVGQRILATEWGVGVGPDAKAPNLLVVAPPPIVETGNFGGQMMGGAAKSRAIGASIVEAARRLGATGHRVASLDLAGRIEPSPVDGVHYDEATHATMARIIGDAFIALVGA